MKKIRFKAHRVRTEDITDSFDTSIFEGLKEASLDGDNLLIRGVCLFGRRESLNGYVYQDQAISTLTKLAEGAKWYLNHPSKSEAKDRDGVRDVRDWAGVFRNVYREGDKVIGDLWVREQYWPLAKDVALMQPEGLGNSINSTVKVFKDEKGDESILDIERLKSVDLVASAATTVNLFESLPERTDNDLREEALHDFEELVEGLLKDKLKEREVRSAINELQWEASSLVDEIIGKEDLDFKTKKEEIGKVLDDLESEIKKLVPKAGAGKKEGDGETETSDPSDKKSQREKEFEDMDLKGLTLELLNKERPDLLDEIKSAFEDAERITKIEGDNETLKAKVEELTKQVESLTTEKEELSKANEEMKTKLDAIDNEKKAAAKTEMIAEKIKEAKLPDEAVTEHFKATLMKMDEEEIAEAIADRLAVWEKAPTKKGVKNAGQEYQANTQESASEDELTDEKKESVKKKFIKTMK